MCVKVSFICRAKAHQLTCMGWEYALGLEKIREKLDPLFYNALLAYSPSHDSYSTYT